MLGLCSSHVESLWLQEIYQEMDHNHVGTIAAHEMRTALTKAGEDLSCRRDLRTQVYPLEIVVLKGHS